uniref:Transmembrane protein n=1 Tax=Panagrellus redivivus TaxID=6233 RepID=A0A7E4VXD9_PANRE
MSEIAVKLSAAPFKLLIRVLVLLLLAAPAAVGAWHCEINGRPCSVAGVDILQFTAMALIASFANFVHRLLD